MCFHVTETMLAAVTRANSILAIRAMIIGITSARITNANPMPRTFQAIFIQRTSIYTENQIKNLHLIYPKIIKYIIGKKNLYEMLNPDIL